MTQKPKTMHQARLPQAKNLQQNLHCHASMAIAKLKATGWKMDRWLKDVWKCIAFFHYMGVSENSGTPKSSIKK